MPATVTRLTASPSSVALEGSVTFSATVTGADPSGTVTFFHGTTVLGRSTVDASGLASFTTTLLPAGVQVVSAVYGGDDSNDPSASPPITVGVANALLAGQRTGSGTSLSSAHALGTTAEQFRHLFAFAALTPNGRAKKGWSNPAKSGLQAKLLLATTRKYGR